MQIIYLYVYHSQSMEQFWPDECKQVYGPLVVEGLHKMADPSNDSVVVWDLTVALHRVCYFDYTINYIYSIILYHCRL